jgi:hypothetical protein
LNWFSPFVICALLARTIASGWSRRTTTKPLSSATGHPLAFMLYPLFNLITAATGFVTALQKTRISCEKPVCHIP